MTTYTNAQGKFDEVAFIMDYEDGDLDEAIVVNGIQQLINSGTIWHLQGSYQRLATMLLNAQICHPASRN